MNFKTLRTHSGFTLIEVMIAITLFSAIMILGTGAVLDSSFVHKKTQAMRAVMDNLNFVMEDMSRNLRLGSKYSCQAGTPNNCKEMSFLDMNGDLITYTITRDKQIKKNGLAITPMPPAVEIHTDDSGFTISGENPTDQIQPLVTIKLSGTVTTKGAQTNFKLQTSVSQRALDI